MSHIPVPPAGRLGKIQYDPNQKQYCVCKNDRRPGFESHVDVVLPFHGLLPCPITQQRRSQTAPALRLFHFSARILLSSCINVLISLNWRYTDAKRT